MMMIAIAEVDLPQTTSFRFTAAFPFSAPGVKKGGKSVGDCWVMQMMRFEKERK